MSIISRKAGAPQGNGNAKKGKHSRDIFSLSGPTYDLMLDALALQGNANPTKQEKQDAIFYALRIVYGRTLEDEGANII